MFDDPEPGPPPEGEPAPFVPDDLAPRLSETELVADIWSAQTRQAREYAMELVAIARLARRRRRDDLMARGENGGPGVDTRALAAPELADVSEDFVTELALIRTCTETEALVLARESILTTTTLEPTWSELYAGRISVRHLKVMVDLLGDASPEVAAEVQRRILPRAEHMTVPAMRERARYQLYRLDAEAKERRRREAVKEVNVRVWRKDEGVGTLGIDMDMWRCLAANKAIDEYAWMMRSDGDERPIGVLRSEAAWALLMRPWDTSRPPVTAHLFLHAPLPSLRPDGDPRQSQNPCEIEGQVVSAAECRELLRELDMLRLGDPPAGGSTHVAVTDPLTGEVIAVATRAELERGAGRRRVHRRRASRPSGRDADGPGLSRPPDTSGYEPTAAQKRLVKTRDRHCRMPGCRRRPGRCDIDHGRAYRDGGPTACWNLCCLCRRHHRIKTFARGWHFELLPDGRLIVRTPSGVYRMTRPPGWCYDAEPDPPWLDDLAPPDPMLT
jgi:hypothetical protein